MKKMFFALMVIPLFFPVVCGAAADSKGKVVAALHGGSSPLRQIGSGNGAASGGATKAPQTQTMDRNGNGAANKDACCCCSWCEWWCKGDGTHYDRYNPQFSLDEQECCS